MSHFKTALIVKEVDGGWELQQDLIYHSDYLGRDIVVPVGFFTDLSSVPRIFHPIVPVATGKNRRASIPHDYLCVHGKEEGVTQRQADIVFREALGVCGVSKIGQWGLFIPVRCFQAIKGVFK